jgi:hypothetical protein
LEDNCEFDTTFAAETDPTKDVLLDVSVATLADKPAVV